MPAYHAQLLSELTSEGGSVFPCAWGFLNLSCRDMDPLEVGVACLIVVLARVLNTIEGPCVSFFFFLPLCVQDLAQAWNAEGCLIKSVLKDK